MIFKNVRSMLMALKDPYKSIDGKLLDQELET